MIPQNPVIWKVRCFVKPYEKGDRRKYEQATMAFQDYCKSELGGVPHSIQKDDMNLLSQQLHQNAVPH